MKQKTTGRGAWLAALGLVLMLLGAAALFSAGDTLQFVFPAPAATQEGNELSALYEAGMEQLSGISDSFEAYAIGARRQGAALSAGGGKSAQATLYAVGEGYFDVMHETLRAGRFVSGADVRRAEAVIVIEEGTALSLFPGVEPVGQTLTLDGAVYEVAGVIAGGRRLGEADEAVCYVPITSAGKNALAMHTVACVGRAVEPIGSAILMEDTLRTWQPLGSFYSLSKMRLGAAMPLRWAMLIVGLYVLLGALARLNRWTAGRAAYVAGQLRTRYLRQMAGMLLWDGLCALAAYGAILALIGALAVFSIQPLYVFTEWVPEVIVEWSSLSGRFWALHSGSSAAIRCATRETAVMALGEGLVQWGFMAALLGAAIRRRK